MVSGATPPTFIFLSKRLLSQKGVWLCFEFLQYEYCDDDVYDNSFDWHLLEYVPLLEGHLDFV